MHHLKSPHPSTTERGRRELRHAFGFGLSILATALLSCAIPGSDPNSAQLRSSSSSQVDVQLQDSHFLLQPEPNLAHEKGIDGNQRHIYHLSLNAGDYLHLAVEQKDIDLDVGLYQGAERLLWIDTPTRDWGPEKLWYVSEQGGEYELWIEPYTPGDPAGEYSVKVEERHPAEEADRAKAQAAATLSEAEELRRNGGEVAERLYREALRLWDPQDHLNQGTIWHRLGLLTSHIDFASSENYYKTALGLFRQSNRLRHEGEVLNELGLLHQENQKLETALQFYDEAFFRAQTYPDIVGETLIRQGLLFDQLAYFGRAANLFEEAVNTLLQAGHEMRAARALTNLGAAYISLGRHEEALNRLDWALLIRGAGSPVDRANTLRWKCHAELNLNQPEDAAASGQEARSLLADDDLGEISRSVWGCLARAKFALNKRDEAHDAANRALTAANSDPASEAPILSNYAESLEAIGSPATALPHAEEAVRLMRGIGDPNGLAHALYVLARVELALALLPEARAHIEESLQIVEQLRGLSEDPLIQGFLDSSRNSYHRLSIEIQTRLSELPSPAIEPAAVWRDVESLRARILLEDLVSPSNAKEAPTDIRVSALDVEETQALLDGGTVLLVFSLGDTRSFRWQIGKNSFQVDSLPGREKIEIHARGFNRSNETPGRFPSPQGAHDGMILSEMILAGAEIALNAERLLIMADGVLHYTAFAALPRPDGATAQRPRPLISTMEIVHPPSITAIPLLRQRNGKTESPLETLAILADAIFSREDPRLAQVEFAKDSTEKAVIQQSDRLRSSLKAFSLKELPRLIHSQQEANAISSFLPKPNVLLALGAEANRELLFSAQLRQYDIVHLATHGFSHANQPEFSGIVLSQFGPDGMSRGGAVMLAEISQLQLQASLVVASACRSALGFEVRGDGILGVARAFLSAGASSVLASQWKVDDEATSHLMQHFYRRLLVGKETPAQALRKAQLEMLSDDRWSAPYFWAGFSLYGDWQ